MSFVSGHIYCIHLDVYSNLNFRYEDLANGCVSIKQIHKFSYIIFNFKNHCYHVLIFTKKNLTPVLKTKDSKNYLEFVPIRHLPYTFFGFLKMPLLWAFELVFVALLCYVRSKRYDTLLRDVCCGKCLDEMSPSLTYPKNIIRTHIIVITRIYLFYTTRASQQVYGWPVGK